MQFEHTSCLEVNIALISDTIIVQEHNSYARGVCINMVTNMKATTTTIEDRKCAPASIPELVRLLRSSLLLFLIE